MLTSVVVPVALLGAGAVTVAHAHVRNFVEASRLATALIVTRSALEPTPIHQAEGGRDEALAAVAAHGFLVRITRGKMLDAEAVVAARRLADGQFEVIAPLDDGHATIRFAAQLSPETTTSGVMVGLAALLLAAALALWLGRALARDLILATQHVTSLGAGRNASGKDASRTAALAEQSRFSEVVALGQNIERLAHRFQQFADAQERALLAKARDRRMKQQLFASVSHDLKSPLNAILGFADLIAEKALSDGQRESLQMVSSRGRELLALIETILDAARVDAGQLILSPQPTSATTLLTRAAEIARHLRAGEAPSIVVEAQPHAPPMMVDPVHASRALGVLISHALISSGKDCQLRVAARVAERRQDADAAMLLITIEYKTRTGRASLLESELHGLGSEHAQRSAVLQLSLARSVIELHGGHVRVVRASHDSAVVRCSLPTWQASGDSPPSTPVAP
jgi:signal transduction histidine kinase